MKSLFLITLVACGSTKPTEQHAVATTPIDASVDASPDAGVPEAVVNAPPWVFHFHTADRRETWTLQFAGGNARIVVETATGTQRYLGTAVEGATIKVDVTTGTAKVALECKHAKRALSAKCNDTKAKPIDVLDCFHPDFKEPMPFGPAPGVEYVALPECTGYRLATP